MLALVVAVPATVASAATGHPTRMTRTQTVDVLGIDDEIPVTVKLGCRGHVENGEGAVGCHWRSIDDRAVASWQLRNLQVRPEAGVRNLVAELGPDAEGYRDTNVVVPAAYVYAVLALDADGEIIGRSRVAAAVLHERTPHLEPLHLGCAGHRTEVDRAELDAVVPDLAVWVTCEWRPATSDTAAGYVVWRNVDGGEREAIARTGLDQTAIRDDDVSPGHRYRYVIQAVDADGNTVGRSRMVMVAFRPYDRVVDPERDEVRDREADRPVEPETDVRPHDDVRPVHDVDARPVRDADAPRERDVSRDR